MEHDPDVDNAHCRNVDAAKAQELAKGRGLGNNKRRALTSLSDNLPPLSVHKNEDIHQSLLCSAVNEAFTISKGKPPAGTGDRQDSGYIARLESVEFEDDDVQEQGSSQTAPISRQPTACSNVSTANKMLKCFRINSETTVSFSEDAAALPVRHCDSFDSVIDTSERQESVASASYGEKSSGIDLTCSTSPAKQITHTCWQVFLENYRFNIEREIEYKTVHNYMDRQKWLDISMRSVLVDWLVDVSLEFQFSQETLHVAVYLVDRFLSIMSVTKDKLQLVGTAAMMIAAKYQEIYPPKVKDYVTITDDAYTRQQLLRMERILLSTVNFNIHPPTINEFVAAYTYVARTSRRTQCLAQFLGDLALLEYTLLSYLPSQIGAAASWLALGICESDWHNQELRIFCEQDGVELQPIMEELLRVWRQPSDRQLDAVRQKYASESWHSVSLIAPPKALPL